MTVTAGCDVAEFLLRAGLLTGLLLWHRAAKPEQVCTYLVGSMAAGTLFSTAVLLLLYVRNGSHAVENAAFPLERTFAWQCRWRLAVV